jgi:hypothetical protein
MSRLSDEKNKEGKVRPEARWTKEDRARHQAIRDKFRDWHPSPEALIASGVREQYNRRENRSF